MTQCASRFDPEAECGFDQDRPISNHGCFAFIVPESFPERPIERKPAEPVGHPGDP
jgi:hypothetical protein